MWVYQVVDHVEKYQNIPLFLCNSTRISRQTRAYRFLKESENRDNEIKRSDKLSQAGMSPKESFFLAEFSVN
jgi:hypothetical protein